MDSNQFQLDERSKYTVGWICALPVELKAATDLLDEVHKDRQQTDNNIYTLGCMGHHNVVIAHLPPGQYGTSSATHLAAQMTTKFPIKIGLMVGIGGGAPSSEIDIRLGDVVVSRPTRQSPGVIQYDFFRGSERVHSLAPPPESLLKASGKLEIEYQKNSLRYLREVQPNTPDVLFEASYDHVKGMSNCDQCKKDKIIYRPARANQSPLVHYGTIASANQVMKDGLARDKVSAELGGALCFEMEAAGLMNTFPCLVIRGICDYSDSHKNKQWQPYAAATAAAYAKDLLSIIPPVILSSVDIAEPSSHDMKKALQSLWFTEINLRMDHIGDETPGTCLWFLRHPKYRDWLSQDQGLLWLKGKPGSGKSTLMRFALDQQTSSDGTILASFFFHARAGLNSLQNTSIGLYRSLLHQLCKKIPELCAAFCKELEGVLKSVATGRTDWSFHEGNLRRFLRDYIPRISASKHIRIYIDALDEAGEEIAKNLVRSFHRLVFDARNLGSHLSICFSCRHYPLTTPSEALTIYVEHENSADIGTYLRETLDGMPEALRLENEILEKAKGVFQWVVLVVPMIADLFNEGDYGLIRDRLEGLPEGLESLYEDILTGLASKKRKHSLQLFQWIRFAPRPLTLGELRWAMALDFCPEYQSLNEYTNDTQFMSTDGQISKKVKSLTGGLAEVVQLRIQFIHQSVKDYLVSGSPNGFYRLSDTWDNGKAQFQLVRSCIRYLTMPESFLAAQKFRKDSYHLTYEATISNPMKHVNVSKIERLVSYVRNSLPFTEYCVHHWTVHAAESKAETAHWWDLVKMCRWRRRLFPDYPILYKNVFSPSVSLRSQFDNHLSQSTTLLHVASTHGIKGIVEAILTYDREFDCDIRNNQDETPIHVALKHDRMEIVRLLRQRTRVSMEERDSTGKTPLLLAVSSGNDLAAKYLIEEGEADVNAEDAEGETSLMTAIRLKHDAILRLLLTRPELDVRKCDKSGQTPLVAAVRANSPKKDRREEIDDSMFAENSRCQEIFELLLLREELHADFRDGSGRSALSWAASLGQTDFVEYLLARPDVEPDSLDLKGRTPLSRAAESGQQQIVRLLAKRRDVLADSRDVSGRTPLSWAAARSRKDTVEFLISSCGVDANSKDREGRTPLYYASTHKFFKTIMAPTATTELIQKAGGTL
ncbi:MAG: hypothetical protein M1822_002075 [Bathelium mastoideum]|nr:MAG: hypothetical protein M1822_002075 [Bathelium mastoideum]